MCKLTSVWMLRSQSHSVCHNETFLRNGECQHGKKCFNGGYKRRIQNTWDKIQLWPRVPTWTWVHLLWAQFLTDKTVIPKECCKDMCSKEWGTGVIQILDRDLRKRWRTLNIVKMVSRVVKWLCTRHALCRDVPSWSSLFTEKKRSTGCR